MGPNAEIRTTNRYIEEIAIVTASSHIFSQSRTKKAKESICMCGQFQMKTKLLEFSDYKFDEILTVSVFELLFCATAPKKSSYFNF